MYNKMMRILICVLGVLLVIGFVSLVFSFIPETLSMALRLLITAGVSALSFVALLFASKPIGRMVAAMATRVDGLLGKIHMGDLFFTAIGIALGLWVASLISALLRDLPYPLFLPISSSIYIILAFLFGNTARKRWRELPFLPEGKVGKSLGAMRAAAQVQKQGGSIKLLDTSALIDGRIAPICASGFVEGTLIAPAFILAELQQLADSADSEKRRKGRRGLEVLGQLKRDAHITLSAGQYEDAGAQDCDVKLLGLAKKLGAAVITTDYNLNKVAQVSGVPVLNVNELSSAIRQAPIAGDLLRVLVQKPGKEENQGVGYLEDGTMIVVQDGKRYVGKTAEVLVTSALQTNAGRMVFGKVFEDESMEGRQWH